MGPIAHGYGDHLPRDQEVTTSGNPLFAGGGACRIGAGTVGVVAGVIPIGDPFHDVAGKVVHAIGADAISMLADGAVSLVMLL